MIPGPELGERLRSVFREGAVSSDPQDIAASQVSNPIIDPAMKPSYIVRPSKVDELQELLRLANESGLNLTVASSAGNHSRGGFAATKDNILIDLSPWKRIPWINRRNRVCLIEPGVTYGELLQALEPQGMTIPMPLSPRSGKSVIASMMDREPTTWPNRQWDISDPVASTEFIFGNGDLFRTGAAGGPGTLEQQRAVGGAQKSPLGPSQTDFHRVVQGSQGTMGIVTWITVRAELRPTVEQPFLLGADSLSELIPFVYDVQTAVVGGAFLCSQSHCGSYAHDCAEQRRLRSYTQFVAAICLSAKHSGIRKNAPETGRVSAPGHRIYRQEEQTESDHVPGYDGSKGPAGNGNTSMWRN